MSTHLTYSSGKSCCKLSLKIVLLRTNIVTFIKKENWFKYKALVIVIIIGKGHDELVQILDKTVCISYSTNIIVKCKHQ